MKNFTILNVGSPRPLESVQIYWQTLDPNYKGKRLDFDVEHIKVGDEMIIRFRKNGETIYAFNVVCEIE